MLDCGQQIHVIEVNFNEYLSNVILLNFGFFHIFDVMRLGSSTLPRTTTRATDTEGQKVATATSSTSLYDNVASGTQSMQSSGQGKFLKFISWAIIMICTSFPVTFHLHSTLCRCGIEWKLRGFVQFRSAFVKLKVSRLN